MNSRQIEQIAVGAVKDIFLKNGLFNRKRVRDATLLSIFQFFTFAARI